MKIIVGVDGSKYSLQALKEAIKIAQKFDSYIYVITVYTRANSEEVNRIQESVLKPLEADGVEYKFMPILGSNPSRALVDLGREENCDLIVIGSRGLGSTATFFLGSVSREVVSKATCNVLVVKSKR